jgi:hypothetical protein
MIEVRREDEPSGGIQDGSFLDCDLPLSHLSSVVLKTKKLNIVL